MIPCPAHEQLERLLAEELDEPERSAVEAHIEGCPSCQRRLEELAGGSTGWPPAPRSSVGERSAREALGTALLRRLEAAGICHVGDFQEPTTAPGRSTASEAPEACPRVDGYDVLGKVGQGGMGIVYKARDTRLNRLVALKLLRGGAHATHEEVDRFRREAEAAARLQHPHIVQIHEVGESEGRPYLALEFVDGVSLAQKLQGTPMPARQAAELTRTLAQAVQVAHEHGIVHRDIKPANVLLTLDGAPKVADFGLVLMLDSEAAHTRTGAILGTPSYMAPEQAGGRREAVGPQTDVYALGAVLYELLTGRPPFKAETPADTLFQVQTQEPVPPRRLQPRVPRDVETICLKCLQKEPRQRYATAEALATDLDRFLAGRPILARAVGPGGRLWRLCRRNPMVASLLGLSVTGFPVAFAVMLALWLIAEHRGEDASRQQARAHINLDRALDAIERMLLQVGAERLAHVPQMEEMRERLLQEALQLHEKILEEDGTNVYVRRGAGRSYQQMARIQWMLGKDREAEVNYQKALAIQEELTAAFPKNAEYQRDLAATLQGLGVLARTIGRFDQAEESLSRALHLQEELAARYPEDAANQQQLAIICQTRGEVYHAISRTRDAETAYRRALQIRQGLPPEFPSPTENQSALAENYTILAQLISETGRWSATEPLHQKARDVLEVLAAAHPHLPDAQVALAKNYQNSGRMYAATARKPKGIEQMARAQEILERIVREHPLVPSYRSDLAELYWYVGMQHQFAMQWDKTKAIYAKGLEIREELVRQHPNQPKFAIGLATSYGEMGLYYDGLGMRTEALKWFERNIAILNDVLNREARHTNARRFLSNIHLVRGRIHIQLGRHEDAREDWHRLDELGRDQRHIHLRLNRAYGLAWLKEYAKALAELDAVGQDLAGTERLRTASVCGRCLEGLIKDSSLELAERDRLIELLAERALEVLKNVEATGGLPITRVQFVWILKSEADYAYLRSRDDFKKLLADLAAAAQPPAAPGLATPHANEPRPDQ